MSLNSVTLSPSRVPTPALHEISIREVEHIEYTLSEGSSKKFDGRGKVFLTDLRLILVPDSPTDAFTSLAAPHTSLLSMQQEPPRLFSPPRLQLDIKPAPGGGLGDAPCRLQLQFSKNDKETFHSFAGALDKTRERAVARSRANPEDELDLPAYSDPGQASTSSAKPPAQEPESTIPYDAPPGYDSDD